MHDALALRPQSADAAGEDLHGRHSTGLERVAEFLVSREASPEPARGREQRRLGVDKDSGAP